MFTELKVPESTNIIINDTPIVDSNVRYAFARLKNTALASWIILSSAELNTDLLPKITTDILLLFPGNGSQYIKSELALEGIDIGTEREFIRNKPTNCRVAIPDNLIESIGNQRCQVAIVDDVVASGLTINTIRKSIEYKIWMSGFEPRIAWVCIPWLLQKLAIGKIDQAIKVNPCVVYSRDSSKVSVNSLSTLLEDSPKGTIVRKTYATKYFTNGKGFLDSLTGLKQI